MSVDGRHVEMMSLSPLEDELAFGSNSDVLLSQQVLSAIKFVSKTVLVSRETIQLLRYMRLKSQRRGNGTLIIHSRVVL